MEEEGENDSHVEKNIKKEDCLETEKLAVTTALALIHATGDLEITENHSRKENESTKRRTKPDESKVKLLENILSLWLKDAMLSPQVPKDQEILNKAKEFGASLNIMFSYSEQWLQNVKKKVEKEINPPKKKAIAERTEDQKMKFTPRRSGRKRKLKVFDDSYDTSVVICKVEDVVSDTQTTQEINAEDSLQLEEIDEKINEAYTPEPGDEICPITGLRIYGDDANVTAYMSETKKKRILNPLTQAQKKIVCQYVKKHPKCTRLQMMNYCQKHFSKKIGKTTAGEIRKNMDRWIHMKNPSTKSPRSKGGCNYPELERILAEWVRNVYTNYGYIPEKLIINKAKKIGAALGIKNFAYSIGWVSTFKARHDLQKYKFLNAKKGEKLLVKCENDGEDDDDDKSDSGEVDSNQSENEEEEENVSSEEETSEDVVEQTEPPGGRRTRSKRRKVASPKKIGKKRISVTNNDTEYPDEYKVPDDCLDEEYDEKGWLTLQQKREICQFHLDHPSVIQKELRKIFSYRFKKTIAKTTLSGIIKDCNKWINTDPLLGSFKQKGKYPLLDKALSNWINKGLARGFNFTNKLIYEQARVFGEKLAIHGPEWNYSEYWLNGFKKRYGFEDLCKPVRMVKKEEKEEVEEDKDETLKAKLEENSPTELSEDGELENTGENSETNEIILKEKVVDTANLSAFDPSEISPGATKRAMVFLNPLEKHKICLYYQANPNVTSGHLQEYAKQHFDKVVGKSTVNDLKKSADLWAGLENAEEQVYRLKKGKHPFLEEILAKWMNEMLLSGTMPSVREIINKAKELAPTVGIGPDDFKFKDDWVVRFKGRFGFFHPEKEKRAYKGRKKSLSHAVEDADMEQSDALFTKLISEMEEAEKSENQEERSEQIAEVLDDSVVYWHFKMKDKVPSITKSITGTKLKGQIKYCNAQKKLVMTDQFSYKLRSDDVYPMILTSHLADYTSWNDMLISLNLGHCLLELYYCEDLESGGRAEYILRTQQQWESALEDVDDKRTLNIMVKLITDPQQEKYQEQKEIATVTGEGITLEPQALDAPQLTLQAIIGEAEDVAEVADIKLEAAADEQSPSPSPPAAPKNIFQCGQCFSYIQVPEGLDQNAALSFFFTAHSQSCPGTSKIQV